MIKLFETLNELDLVKFRLQTLSKQIYKCIYDSPNTESKLDLSDIVLTFNDCISYYIEAMSAKLKLAWDSYFELKGNKAQAAEL